MRPTASPARLRPALAVLLALSATAPVAADEVLDRGKTLFNTEAAPPCAICHTLADAGSAGEIGPNLDTLAPDESRVRTAVSGGIGVMPAYADLMPAGDIDALATYVAAAVKP